MESVTPNNLLETASELIISRKKLRKYTLDELLAKCDFSLPMREEDKEWMNSPPVGREII
jgi:antitoxin ChpS